MLIVTGETPEQDETHEITVFINEPTEVQLGGGHVVPPNTYVYFVPQGQDCSYEPITAHRREDHLESQATHLGKELELPAQQEVRYVGARLHILEPE